MKANQGKQNSKVLFEMLPQAIAEFKKNIIEPFFTGSTSYPGGDERLPLRSEIYTEEQLELHARALSRKHSQIAKQPSELLLKRLAENERILLEVHSILTKSVSESNRIAPAGEWLLDNFYLIEEQIYTAKKHLPKGYSRGLPQLAKGISAGLPRVYELAVEIISHSDGHVNLKSLASFVISYQTVTTLHLGELWAIPIMLRLALLENLRRLAIQISIDINNKDLAETWANKLIETAETDPKNLVIVIADLARSNPPMESSFVAEFTRRLQEKGNSLVLVSSWLEQILSEQGLNSNDLVQQENQKQAADQVSISNSISSLRFLSTTDWQEFVELTSIVEQILREDPAEVYPLMDFHSRDHYRHVIEKIAKSCSLPEETIARRAVDLASQAKQPDAPGYTTHVGFYLKGRGLRKLERCFKMKLGASARSRRIAKSIPLTLYIGSIFLITGLITWGLGSQAYDEGGRSWKIAILLVMAILASSRVAVALVNWLVTILAKPRILPRMDFSKGIPEEFRSMVVVPTILSSNTGISDLLEMLEVRFLSNRDVNLSFALLTDFKDAPSKEMPDDESLIRFASNRILELNRKYGRERNDSFLLFHRDRQFNAKEKVWMGYERKRGKLGALNALILGEESNEFSVIIGEENIYRNTKYIITLDSDTQLPRDSAWKMIATMAHPLNQPVYNSRKKKVVEGYTILQPRVSNSLSVAGSSIYAKAHGNQPGTDPYTRAISDVYQDMFEEGSFIGKGIYDVKSFELALKNRFPENRILSHDLLEGAYGRAGLISDVQLYEEYPSSYFTDMQRRHRWIRGDWQIASWLLPFVPGAEKRYYRNPLSLLSKWKIFDNLRRSLVPIGLLFFLVFGWTISPHHFFWTGTVMVLLFLPEFLNFIWQLIHKPADVTSLQHIMYVSRTLKDNFFQQAVDFICLPYEVFMNTDAIIRTLWRMYISKRKLLQWNPYASQQQEQKTVATAYKMLWISPVFAGAVFIYLAINLPITLIKVVPFLGLWFLAPFVAWYISRNLTKKKIALSDEKSRYLRKLARKIWSFYETFITEEDNWLPPDNYQEKPIERIAHRTSPTNIGLALLSNLTAYDFGYITARELVDLTSRTIQTMLRMEKYRGHLYNWYDTQSLVPLAPRYISTVDSGNLIGHLITLKEGLLRVPDTKIVTPSMFAGLLDEISILAELTKLPGLEKFREELIRTIDNDHTDLKELKQYIDHIERSLTSIFLHADIDPEKEVGWWIQKIFTHIRNIRTDLAVYIPWLSMADAPEKLNQLVPTLPGIPTLKQIARIEQSLLNKINLLYEENNTESENTWLTEYRAGITESGRRAKEIILITEQLAARAEELATVDYDFLYDRSQHLLTIGYNVEEHRRDNSFYDLLASEARLTSFVAIAQGKLPQQNWFALGRQLTNAGTTPILLSWSGSMFEYLMPMLVMPSYENTLLDQTMKAVVQKQIDYGRKRSVPWGISESGYNMVDASLNYQYHAFGVPGLGFKRGLGEDLVVSPYSTVMALMVAPREAYDNLQVLKEEGYEGKYGFYEAIDYTPARLMRKQSAALIQSFMVHHQGMSFLSLSHLLLEQPMQIRFESNVQIKSALLLLQERIPRVTTFYSPSVHEADISIVPGGSSAMRVLNTPSTIIPEVQLLSNGRYHVMVTNAGGGYSRWRNLSLTRWREDATCDNWGTFCFVRDLDNNSSWSASYQPTLKESENYEAVFSQGRAEFRRRDMNIETHTEIVVSPEDDIELRRVHLTNRSRKKRTIEITSYAEIVMNTAAADEAHPAFSNLFVQTEIIEPRNAIVCTRRPRSVDEHNPFLFHLMKVHDAEIKEVSYETDRDKFMGRGYTINSPVVINKATGLTNSSGPVLDPVVAIQYRIVLEPYQTVMVDMILGISDTKEQCNFLIEKYQDRHLINRVLELAWTHSQVILRQINASESEAQLYGRLASSIIYANQSLRTDAATIIKNQRGQSGLWSYSISGDLPIVLLQIADSANIDIVRQMVQAHAYWRMKGLLVDLVIWNEDHGGYRQVLLNEIQGMVAPALSNELRDQPGGIFIRSSDQISNEDRVLFQTVARIVISDKLGTLEEQINGRTRIKTTIPAFSPTKIAASLISEIKLPNDLQFFNGFGGFSADGKEYVIITRPDKFTPAPWINVIANPQFGTVISESGQSYTWVENAHEFRLTPWNNDPITDLKGEAYYIRDEESGKFWSPTPLPARGNSDYITRHGFGYSKFEHIEDGIESELIVYTDIAAPVKFMVLKIRNKSERRRRISATGYVEWVLADTRSKSLMHIITEVDSKSGAILARNPYNGEFENRLAFFDVDDPNKYFTTDRTEFIGRNGTLANPEAMNRTRLSGRSGAALDPCAAIQVSFDLAEDQEHEVVFRLGAGKNLADALAIIQLFEGAVVAQKSLEKVREYWDRTLNAVQITTPDAGLNILSNSWLNYQTIACRIWARSGFYQSGGAFGFRDQLQDVLSLFHAKPNLAREQILLCASRQFKEGDVQHWWHPPKGRGVRTTCSDDFLWLPYVTSRYVSVTGDHGILNEQASFLEGRVLNLDEESYYDLPLRSDQSTSLYEHCVRAIEHGLRFGPNGLPLIGSGDWNDGMDKVGTHGKGESVWLAFFLYDILTRFMETAQLRNDHAFSAKCLQEAEKLKANIEKNAWDGEWYRRAYFDDGTPLGSKSNDECKIDSIAQSWSVLSRAGETAHTESAMRSAEKYLVRWDEQIIQLFNPPFDKSDLNPGYIKGYVPGVRENGGQYTHAAIWLVMAFATMGDRKKTWDLLQLINPISHGKDEETIAQYKVDPYVIAADVYGGTQHLGRGGWTWYTGSAGWMYQLIIDSFIGLKRKGASLSFTPCLPEEWPSVKVKYTFFDTVYNIELVRTIATGSTQSRLTVDGKEETVPVLNMVNDGIVHEVKLLVD